MPVLPHRQNLFQRYSEGMQPLAELPFVAGNVALDFTNTAEERGHPLCGEVLHTPDDLRIWGCRYGVVDPGASSPDPPAELSLALGARELLYRIWLSRVHGGTEDRGDLASLAELGVQAYAAGSLGRGDDGRIQWSWDRSQLASIRHVAVTAALELLARPVAVGSRLKQCPGDHCGWFFLDTTKRGNRRWCLMSECGQAAKTANRRKREGGDGAPGSSR